MTDITKSKILIGIPNNRETLPVFFVKSLFGLFAETKKLYDVEILMYGTTYVGAMRNFLCQYAINNKFDYIFMTDADEIYPKESIIKLMSHNLDIVSGFYQRRKKPYSAVQFQKDIEINAEQLNNPAGALKMKTGLQEAGALGMGGVLMKTETLSKLPQPLFSEIYKSNVEWMGEDMFFSQLCRDNNVKMWCDTDLIFPHEATNVFILEDKFMQVDE